MTQRTLHDTREALARLADGLDARRRSLLETWRDLACADASLDAASEWSLLQFNDHFPDVLDAFSRILRAWPDVPDAIADDERAYAFAHARARWIQGYSLRGVVREWGHFNAVVVDQLLALADEPAVARASLAAWSRVLNDQQSLSALEYHQLEQAEAETRAVELMRALDAVRSGAVLRGRAMEALSSTMRNDLQLVMTTSTLAHGADLGPETHELRKLSDDGFRGLEQALSDLATLAHLEAGHEARQVEALDAGHGIALLVEGLHHVAAQRGATLSGEGPDRLPVQGDEERVRRIAKHLLFCALRSPEVRDVAVHWGPCPDTDARWYLTVEHALPASSTPDGGVGHAVAVATHDAQAVTGDATPAGVTPPGAIPVAEGDGVDLLIAKHLCDLLGGGLQIDTGHGRLRYRVTLPTRYRNVAASRPPRAWPDPEASAFRH
ncbi:sensor histidine kinase [Lysobacter xanthus]